MGKVKEVRVLEREKEKEMNLINLQPSSLKQPMKHSRQNLTLMESLSLAQKVKHGAQQLKVRKQLVVQSPLLVQIALKQFMRMYASGNSHAQIRKEKREKREKSMITITQKVKKLKSNLIPQTSRMEPSVSNACLALESWLPLWLELSP